MKKSLGILIAVAALAVIGIMLFKRSEPKSNSGQTRITIAQWGQEKYLIYLPVYIAQEKGFFKAVSAFPFTISKENTLNSDSFAQNPESGITF